MSNLLEKYAELAVKIGANVQKDQIVFINSTVDCAELTRLIVKKAYNAGAKSVIVNWADDAVTKMGYQYRSLETLSEVPDFLVERVKYITEVDSCVISIVSGSPDLLKDIDPMKLQKANQAMSAKVDFYRTFMMKNSAQWTIVAYPSKEWANKVFPNDKKSEEKLLKAILDGSRVKETNDPIKAWKEHIAALAKNNKTLNDYNFRKLNFKNSLGTELEVGLVEGHIWAGGGEKSIKGHDFAPNIPTEEAFTMPSKFMTQGKVVSTKPLSYNGNLIVDFFLEFKDGKVVNFGAKEGLETLKNLLEFDEGAKYIGEVALISHNSPISQSNVLFYNTLFDENASCHLALGAAYPMNIKNGTMMSQDELIKKGYNASKTHVDFMFGSACMEIMGTTSDGEKVQIFKNGNFIL
ncbi:MAG: aminopeptidase [Erysipelotrichales bacterium]|nr:aminopeptidase [Erysipelotrichales bacterium]